MNYKNLVCTNVKILREKNGLTQAQFAEIINISIEALRNIEQFKSTPTAKTIDGICASFNVTPFDLLLPPTGKDETSIIDSINKKLKLCSNNQLLLIEEMIDLIRQRVK